MTEERKQILLAIVRDAVAAAVTGEAPPKPACDDPELNVHQGCFVTLKNRGRLRGCIGQFIADKPLVQVVFEMAVSAATRDPRFTYDPVTPEELISLDVEISVLSALEKTDDPLSLRLGIDGIYIVRGQESGCFLPQVVTETGWDAEEFLANCCVQKAGLPADAWRDSQTDVFLFTADIFEAAFGDI